MKAIFRFRIVRVAALALTGMAMLALPSTAQADTVTSWHSDVAVNATGAVSVKETIVYDPLDGSHHGIERTVPAHMNSANGQKYFVRITLTSITDGDGRAVAVDTKEVNRQGMYLRIGSADTLLAPGPHTYVISYVMEPFLTHLDANDRLNINVIGNDWRTPVQLADATITWPAQTDAASRMCYTGFAGSTQQDCQIFQASPGKVRLSANRGLDAGEALTADISLPTLNLSGYLVAGQRPPLTPGEWAVIVLDGLALLGLLLGGVVLIGRSWRQGQERRRQTIIPQYEPPAGLSPAQLSIVESPAADVADVTATIIHLAVRGVLRLEQTRAKSWLTSADYRLTLLGPAEQPAPVQSNEAKQFVGSAQLSNYESSLLAGLFKAGQTNVLLSELKKRPTEVSAAVQKFRQQLGADLTKRGYFLASPTGSLLTWQILLGTFGLGTAVAAAAVAFEGGVGGAIALAAVAMVLSVVFAVVSRRPSGRSQAGNQQWAAVRGFKWFMEVTEKDRLAFSDAPDRTPELFSRMLPYAIALKVEKQWARQFAGIDVSAAVGGWYAGYAIGNFSADNFTSSFSSSFSGAMTSSFAGSSGGGSAGGGGGGGGGGGW